MGFTEQRPWERPKGRVRVRLCTGLLVKVVLAQDSRYRSWPPALPGTRSCPGPGRHRVMAENSFLIRRSACGASRHRRRYEVQGIGSELGRAPPRAPPLAQAPHAQASRALRPLLRRDQGTRLVGPHALDHRLPLPRLHLCGALARGGRGDV